MIYEDPGTTEALREMLEALFLQPDERSGGRNSVTEHEEKGKDAVGDIIIFLADYATARGWDLQEIIEQTWAKVKQRDWQANPQNGNESLAG